MSNLRKIRRQRRMTLRALGAACGEDFGSISRDERADERLTLHKMYKYARALKCTVGEIAGEIPFMTEEQRRDYLTFAGLSDAAREAVFATVRALAGVVTDSSASTPLLINRQTGELALHDSSPRGIIEPPKED